MLRVSEAANLAIHALAYLGAAPEDAHVPVGEIARGLRRSPTHLAKVLHRLARAGLVGSARGLRGGYRLERAAAAIPVLEILEAVDGKLVEEGCILGEPICDRGACVFRGLQRDILDQTRRRLGGVTLADFRIRPALRGRKHAVPSRPRGPQGRAGGRKTATDGRRTR